MKKIKKKLADYLLKRITDPEYYFKVKKDDVFLISYPKSGTTWMRFLLANMFTDKEVNLTNLGEFVPDIYKNKREDMDPDIRLQIFKTHSHFRSKYSKNKIICLIRDPRDVAVSYYFYYQKTKDGVIGFEDFFEKFLSGDLDGFGNWKENVGSWIGAKEGDNNFLVIRYEDMLSDLKNQLIRVVNFIGLDVSYDKIERAIENSDFEKLKADENRNYAKIDTLKDTKKTIPFFRKGRSGDWRNYISEEQQNHFVDGAFGYLMEKYKYTK